MEEIWKDIEGYEGFFKVSNLGRIKSLERVCEHYNGHYNVKRVVKEKIRKQQLDVNGYLSVTISNGDIRKTYKVHRLVAQAFIPNPENKREINHKNGIKIDNRAKNLEWNTRSENIIHAWKNGLAVMTEKRIATAKDNGEKARRLKAKEVIQYDKKMNELNRYNSTKEVQRKLGYDATGIADCCRGQQKTAYGYIWKYKE